MIRPILACEDPYALAGEMEAAGWRIDFSQPPESGDPLVGVSLLGNAVLLGITAGYVSDSEIPYIGCGVSFYITVPGEELKTIHRSHQRFSPTAIVRQPWGDDAFEARIGPFVFMFAAQPG